MSKKKNHGDDTEEEKIKRNLNGNEHIKKCTSGFGFKKNNWCAQIHHILPVSSLQDAHLKVPEDQMEFVIRCIKITDWNINEHYNTVGLPIKIAFYRLDKDKYFTIPRSIDSWSVYDNWDGWPCHQVDHNPAYTEKIYQDLGKKIWNRLIEDREECDIDSKYMRDKLFKASSRWRNFLKDRGREENGTRYCWVHRHDEDMMERWFIPFSMDPLTPRKRVPPPNFSKIPSNLKELLKETFKLL